MYISTELSDLQHNYLIVTFVHIIWAIFLIQVCVDLFSKSIKSVDGYDNVARTMQISCKYSEVVGIFW